MEMMGMEDMEEVGGEMEMVQAEADVDGKVYRKLGWLLVSESMLKGLYARCAPHTVKVDDS